MDDNLAGSPLWIFLVPFLTGSFHLFWFKSKIKSLVDEVSECCTSNRHKNNRRRELGSDGKISTIVTMRGIQTSAVRDIMYICMYGHTCSKSMDQPGKVANPARGQLDRKK